MPTAMCFHNLLQEQYNNGMYDFNLPFRKSQGYH